METIETRCRGEGLEGAARAALSRPCQRDVRWKWKESWIDIKDNVQPRPIYQKFPASGSQRQDVSADNGRTIKRSVGRR